MAGVSSEGVFGKMIHLYFRISEQIWGAFSCYALPKWPQYEAQIEAAKNKD